jgi:hypothetical protein
MEAQRGRILLSVIFVQWFGYLSAVIVAKEDLLITNSDYYLISQQIEGGGAWINEHTEAKHLSAFL